jgi:asparagine synthetase B (glutamine-hydrolysing)
MASPLIVESSVALYLAAKTSALPEGQPVLNGAGADALFAGSTNLFKFSLLRRLIGQSIPFRVEHQERWFERLRSRLGRLGIRTATSVDPGGLDLMLGARRMEYYMEYERLLGGVQHLPPGPDREIAALMLQNFGGHMKSLVMRLDPVARAAKTHMFLPFLEESLVRFALNLPLSVKLKPSRLRLRPTPKWVLKRVASRHVPPRLLFGPKVGFEMPGGRWTGPLPRSWIRDSWVASLFEIPAPAPARWLERSRHSRDRMFFATMEIWGRLFDAGQRLEDVEAEWLDASDESEKAAVSRTTPAGVRSASGLVR